MESLQSAAGIPLAYRNRTFKDFGTYPENLKALNRAMQLKSLYIHGDSCSGKTLLLSLIANEHIRHGTPVQYTTAAKLLFELRYNSEECETRLAFYNQIPVLLIDDLGLERQNPFSEEQLYLTLEGRWRLNNTTVIASRVKLADLPYKAETREKILQAIEEEEELKRESYKPSEI